MHTLYNINKNFYTDVMKRMVKQTDKEYKKPCYISFNDPYNIVIRLLTVSAIEKGKFIVVDASNPKRKEVEIVDEQTYIMPPDRVFDVYMFLRGLIMDNNVDHLILDSLSALIYKFHQLPLKEMLTDLLLEVGSHHCDSSLVVFSEHQDHEVVRTLEPFFARNIVL